MYSGLLSQSFNHDQDHGAGEMGSPSVQEHIILLTGFDVHPAAVVKPIAQFLDGSWRNRYQAFLPSLSLYPQELLVEIEVR